MSLLRRWVLANWPLKLTALGLAVVLYAGVAISESTRTWTAPVPIEVLDAPVGGVLLSDPGSVVRIDFRAPDDIAAQLTSESFQAAIDLSGVEPREGASRIDVPVEVVATDPRVQVLDYEPTDAVVQLDRVVSRVAPVRVDPGPVPEGIELGPVIADPNQVTIRGASSRIQDVRTVEGRFVVDASGVNVDEDVRLEAFDVVGAIVTGVDIEPASVRVRADVARQLAYATVPVIPELTGEPASGMRVDNVSVLPATVTVSGENPDVRQLQFVSTEAVDISGQSVELVAETRLVLPADVASPGDEGVTVLVTFTPSLGSRSYEVATALVGVRPGFTYQLEEPSVDIIVAGPVAQLDDLALDALIAEVPVGGLSVGDNVVMPIVRPPRGLELVRVTPRSVRVIVAQPAS